MWSGDSKLAQWSASNGFGHERSYTFDELDNVGSKISGLYVFESQNHEAYIGISTDLRSRLKQHAKRHNDIAAFRLRILDGPTLELRSVERSLVHSAQQAGLTLRNREHAMTLTGESVFDSVVAPQEQSEWLRDPVAMNAIDTVLAPEYTASQRAAHLSSFDRLQQHPRRVDIVDALSAYLKCCVPFPARTEGTFWTVSCFPGSSSSRFACVSMAMLETFYIWNPPASELLEIRMFVDGSRIPKRLFPSRKQWRKLAPGVWLGPSAHKSAGVNERTIKVDDVSYLSAALAIPGLADAAAHHALAVMRKRQSGYKPSHCPQLAAAAVDSSQVRSELPTSSTIIETSPEEADQLEPVGDANLVGDAAEEPDQATSAHQKLVKFHDLDVDGRALEWLGEFIEASLPDSSSDAGTSWGVTCLPATRAGTGRRRMFTVNVGAMEVAYVIRDGTGPTVELIATAVVSRAALEVHAGRSIDELAADNPGIMFTTVGYLAAAGDDVSVSWPLESVVNDLPWSPASSVLVDSVRGGRSSYGRYHSTLLHAEALRAR